MDQIATFILRALAWLILLLSLAAAAVSISMGLNAQPATMTGPNGPVSIGNIFAGALWLSALLYFFSGLVGWAFLNVIAAIADNLIAIRQTNEDMLRMMRFPPSPRDNGVTITSTRLPASEQQRANWM